MLQCYNFSMLIYKQSTGQLFNTNGAVLGNGYSGKGEHKNNPDSQGLHNLGPIPQGFYTIGSPFNSDKHGPYCLPLIPDVTNEMYGRTGFLCHGDSKEHPGEASEGCIIQARAVRDMMAHNSPRLQVIA